MLTQHSSDQELMAEFDSLRAQACGEEIGSADQTPAEAVEEETGWSLIRAIHGGTNSRIWVRRSRSICGLGVAHGGADACGGGSMLRFTFGAILVAGGAFLVAVALLGQPVMDHAGAIAVTGLMSVVAGCMLAGEEMR
jgi:hypothetical protein